MKLVFTKFVNLPEFGLFYNIQKHSNDIFVLISSLCKKFKNATIASNASIATMVFIPFTKFYNIPNLSNKILC